MHSFGGAPRDTKLLCQGTPDVGFDPVKRISLNGLLKGPKKLDGGKRTLKLQQDAQNVFRREVQKACIRDNVMGSHCGHLELSERIENHDRVQKQKHIVLNVSIVPDDVP